MHYHNCHFFGACKLHAPQAIVACNLHFVTGISGCEECNNGVEHEIGPACEPSYGLWAVAEIHVPSKDGTTCIMQEIASPGFWLADAESLIARADEAKEIEMAEIRHFLSQLGIELVGGIDTAVDFQPLKIPAPRILGTGW